MPEDVRIQIYNLPAMSKPSMNAQTLESKHAILFLNVCRDGNMMVDTSACTGCRNVDTHPIIHINRGNYMCVVWYRTPSV